MKKVGAFLVAVLLIFSYSISFADNIDLSAYDNEALIELLQMVQQEIANRKIEKSAKLVYGSYIVGKDIPAGSYKITIDYTGSTYMDVYIYDHEGNGDLKQDFTVFADGQWGDDGKGEFFVTLNEGDMLKCTADITLTIQAGVMFE